MHRHGYIGKKLGRKRDERRLLLKNLATSLVLDEKITTSLPKAKAVVPYVERLITKAKQGTLHSRRQVIAGLLRDDAAAKLTDDIAPKIKRDSGYLRLERAGFRKGDFTELAEISFVDDLAKPKAAPAATTKKKSAEKAATTKTSGGNKVKKIGTAKKAGNNSKSESKK